MCVMCECVYGLEREQYSPLLSIGSIGGGRELEQSVTTYEQSWLFSELIFTGRLTALTEA